MPSKPAPFPSKARSHFSRSRDGCLTCRSRRKKCDEAKPICGGCELGKRICTWPPSNKSNQFYDGPAQAPSSAAQSVGVGFADSTSGMPLSGGIAAPPPPPPCMAPVQVSARQGSTSTGAHGHISAPAPAPEHNTSSSFTEPVLIHDPTLRKSQDNQAFSHVPKTPPPAPGIIPVQVSRRPTGVVPPHAPGFPKDSSSLTDFNLPPQSQTAAGLMLQAPAPSADVVQPDTTLYGIPNLDPHNSAEIYGPAMHHSVTPMGPEPYVPAPHEASLRASVIPQGEPPISHVPTPIMAAAPSTQPEMGLPQLSYFPEPPGSMPVSAPASSDSPPSATRAYTASSSSVEFYSAPTNNERNTDSMAGYGVAPMKGAQIPRGLGPVDQYEAYTNPEEEQPGMTGMDYENTQRMNPLSISQLIGGASSTKATQPLLEGQEFILDNEEDNFELHQGPGESSGLRNIPPGARPPTPIMIAGYVNVSEDGIVSPISNYDDLNAGSADAPEAMLAKFISEKSRPIEVLYDDATGHEQNAVNTDASSLRIRKQHHKNKKAKSKEMALQNIFADRRKRTLTHAENINRALEVGSLHRTLQFTDGTDFDPRSHLLFKHYLDTVADQLVTCDKSINPFRRHVLPLATKDDILLHAILATGGAYFCFEDSVNPALGDVSRQHYSVVLSRLGPALRSGRYTSKTDRVFLVTIMMLLNLFETLAGRTQGNILMHLIACRTILLSLIEDPPKDTHSEIGVIFGFVCECYCYSGTMAALSTLLCYGAPKIPIDYFMRDLSFLRKYPTYRGFLGIGHSLWEIIPEIVDLGRDRFQEEANGIASIEVFARYRDLLRRVETWTDPDDDGNMRMDWRNASSVYQHTLIIVLHNLYYNDLYSQEEVIADVRLRVEMAFPLLLSVALSSNVGMMMLFPCMVLASCTEQEWLKGTFRYGIMAAKFKSCSMKQALLVLERLWTDNSSEAFGPRGLGYIMKKHGVVFTMT
ncbi:hypothetical protein CFIMG_004684RA [Ceratocystis fimbriata CBS 114723]|uniref:Zn(2)-C6 fungal-type domain-containing protein n=1 Tax=Ceratocystis fimbriata CBS 114723 TaxID=1035309 RepID=A0A2C5WYN5_9PEZI|nr:hypothetical protein CFIMG_004684RA [Ceratocystis fimbriata CBS 114723]